MLQAVCEINLLSPLGLPITSNSDPSDQQISNSKKRRKGDCEKEHYYIGKPH